jgi:PST family polysaccharide transporter
MVTMPVAALPIAVPDLIVDLLLGPQWGGAAPFAMWLGIAALFQPVINTLGWLFVTRDRVREMVRWTVMGSGLRLIAVLGGLPYGAVGVAAAVALSGIAIRVPVLFWAIGRRGPISTLDLVRATGPATVAAVSVIAALSLMRGFVPLPADAPALQLVLAVGVAAGVALLCYAGLPQGRRALRGFRLMRSAFTRVEVPP